MHVLKLASGIYYHQIPAKIGDAVDIYLIIVKSFVREDKFLLPVSVQILKIELVERAGAAEKPLLFTAFPIVNH